MSRRHKDTTPGRKAKGRRPATVRVPFRCMEPDCGRLSVRAVPRSSAGDQRLRCDDCGHETLHGRIHRRPEKVT